jgi:hypothetical protein
MPLQSISDVLLILSIVGGTGLILSILCTLFLLWKFNISNTAWMYAALAAIAFFVAGIFTVVFATTVTIVYFTWAAPLGLGGGYFLIFLAFNQYFRDKRMRETVATE